MRDRLRSALGPATARMKRLPMFRTPARQSAVGVAALVFGAAVLWGLQVRDVANWTVMTDELTFVRHALSLAEDFSLVPTVRGADSSFYAMLYPVLLWPIYGLLDTPAAFDVAHLLNVALMASTAIPAYLLTRAVLPSRLAGFVVAAATVVVPWMGLAVLLRSEALAYPAFVWALLAMQRTLVEPGTGRDLVALLAIGVAVSARTQLVVLAIALPAAVLVHELGFALAARSGEEPWHRSLWAGLRRAALAHPLVSLLVALGLPLAITGALNSLLGAYQGTVSEGSLVPAGIANTEAELLAIVAVGIGIAPLVLALAWSLVTLVRPEGKREHAFVALLLVTCALVTLQASSFVLRFARGEPQDRYVFYVVPLLLVGMAACLLDRRRLWLAIAGATGVVAWLVTFSDYPPGGGPFHGSPARAFHSVLEFHVERVGGWLSIEALSPADVMPFVAAVLGLAAAAAARFAPPRKVLAVVGILLVAFLVAETRSVVRQMVATASPGPERPVGADPRDDWIDAALPEGADVGIVPSPSVVPGLREPDRAAVLWWNTEFWNKRVTSAYVVRGHSDYAVFRNGQLAPDFETGAVAASPVAFSGTPLPDYLVVSTSRSDFYPRGRVVAGSPFGQELIAARPPYRAAWATRGLTKLGWTQPGKPVTLRLYGDRSRSRRVRIVLEAPPRLAAPRLYRVTSGRFSTSGRVIPRDGDLFDENGLRAAQESRPVGVCIPAGRRDATLRVRGATRLPDGQRVGLRLISVRLLPGRCDPASPR